MSLQPAAVEPLKPRQIVIMFGNCPDSGATLGFYGTVTRVLNSSVVRHPSRPDLWVYRVLMPHFGCQFDISARKLFAPGTLAPAVPCAEPVCELEFDAEPADDNEEIHGAYRLPGHDWDYFVFRKSDQPRAGYELRMPAETLRTKPAKLCYSVPRSEVLDRDYVLKAVGDIFGVQQWQQD